MILLAQRMTDIPASLKEFVAGALSLSQAIWWAKPSILKFTSGGIRSAEAEDI